MANENANLVDKRATGLLVIEVRNSNPNGDPDRESDPRQRQDGRGEISPVSFKRKIRDLIDEKDGEAWKEISKLVGVKDEDKERFYILEHRGRDRKQIEKELDGDGANFINKYWDGRIFGNTFLEEGKSTSIKTGVVQFGLGVSISPVCISRKTLTNKSGVEEGKDRGMAPLAFRIVEHGVYCMPFFVNAAVAHKTMCTNEDIAVLLKAIPRAYRGTPSMIRNMVEIRHAWYMEHKSGLGSCSDFTLIDTLTPTRKEDQDAEKPSTSWDDYNVPKELPKELREKLNDFRDLMNEQQ
ncbi:MAG: CRISPR-associated protein [Candidatus Brocadia sp. UTAMX1]|jgi:Cas7 group CRISPR-associated protein Csh2|nr:MAG: CRISPR-associated protein [Candidatus Brocadia sp. UTAMX1]